MPLHTRKISESLLAKERLRLCVFESGSTTFRTGGAIAFLGLEPD